MHISSPFRVVFLFIVISISGLICLPYLDIDLLPKDKNPSLMVSSYLPDASPIVVESSLTQLLENAFSGLTNLKQI
ncbi:MAG: efflux RND transporter permease subunit, partial [Candidatus Roizmanbacteria bacterium]